MTTDPDGLIKEKRAAANELYKETDTRSPAMPLNVYLSAGLPGSKEEGQSPELHTLFGGEPPPTLIWIGVQSPPGPACLTSKSNPEILIYPARPEALPGALFGLTS